MGNAVGTVQIYKHLPLTLFSLFNDVLRLPIHVTGNAAEIGSPKELLDQQGVFAELVDATGPEGSKALRALAKSD